MKTTTPIEMYRAARADGLDEVEACERLMASGLSCDDAADICWLAETGAPAPRWQYEDGTPTAECLEWYRRAERHDTGE